MVAKKSSDEEFIRSFTQYGATETAKRYGMTERNVYRRRYFHSISR